MAIYTLTIPGHQQAKNVTNPGTFSLVEDTDYPGKTAVILYINTPTVTGWPNTFNNGDIVKLVFENGVDFTGVNGNFVKVLFLNSDTYTKVFAISAVSYSSYQKIETANFDYLKNKLNKANASITLDSSADFIRINRNGVEAITTYGLDDKQYAKFPDYFYEGTGNKPTPLLIDNKLVKALHVDGKNFKKFTIDGKIYDFKRANLPADEQTPLQDLIDGYDWTHLSATGKALAANTLTWDQISGEPAIHAGVTITGITHPAIDADGTLVATISFSRHLSDGTTDLATKQVNIAFVLIKAAPFAVWYSDDAGNVYKDGVKTYTQSFPTGKTVASTTGFLFADKDGNIYHALSIDYVKTQIYKNGTLLKEFEGYYDMRKSFSQYNGDIYFMFKNKMYKNFEEFTPPTPIGISNPEFQIDKFGNFLMRDGIHYDSRIWFNKIEIAHYDSYMYPFATLVNNRIGFTGGGGSYSEAIHYYNTAQQQITQIDISGSLYQSSNIYEIMPFKDGYYLLIEDYGTKKLVHYNTLEKGFVKKEWLSLDVPSITKNQCFIDNNKNIYFTTSDKKIWKIEWDGTKFLDPVVLYTTEGSDPLLFVQTAFGAKTGNWGA